MAVPEIMPWQRLWSRPLGAGRVLMTETAHTAEMESARDAFGRQSVANPVTVLDAKQQYDLQPLLCETAATTGGSVAHLPDEGAALLSVDTTSGARVVRQSRRYCTYQPGKSQSVFLTGNLGSPAAGCVARIGYYDDDNGIFFERSSAGIAIVFRSNVTGSVVDTRVEQADWNCDKLDGTGDSGKTLAVGTSAIFTFDMQWLGVGRVRAGVDMDGVLLCAHEFLNDNRYPTTYWTTATLPVRYEIWNQSAPSAGSSMRQICASVQSEGGFDIDRGFAFAAANDADAAVTARVPLITVRPRATFGGITNRQGILPVGFEALAKNNAATLELVYGGTLTGAAWSDVDTTNSGVEWDQAATAISGGVTLTKSFVPAGGNRVSSLSKGQFPALLWLTNSIDGTTTTPLTLVATSTVAQASTIRGALSWVEIR